jgi:hypothetical protein
MCRDCIGCNPDCPDRYWGVTVQTNMLVRCHICGKLNRSANNNCRKCGADLEEAKSRLAPVRCLYTGKMCDNPCSLSKIVNKHTLAAECPRA